MIVCSCTGTTDRDIREGRAHPEAGRRCGGCAPAVRALRAKVPGCLLCPGKATGAEAWLPAGRT